MNTGPLSRKQFVKRFFYLSAIPFTMSSCSKLFAGSKSSVLHDSPDQEIPDSEKIDEMLKNKEVPLIWVFTGDSITHGAKHTHGYRSYPEIFAERIRWELGRTRDIVINTGISGNTTRVILNDLDWRISQFKPNVVSLMIGTNDCATGRIEIKAF